MGKQSCLHEQKLRKGLWSPEEDEKLLKHIAKYGHTCWSSVPKLAGLQRCGKSCRLRWINYLRPDLKRGTFSQQEENLIIKLHAVLGNRWSQIAAQLPGRTDNEIKNLWNSCIKKKLRHKGIDPNTHKPLSATQGGEDHKTPSGSENLKHRELESAPELMPGSEEISTSFCSLAQRSSGIGTTGLSSSSNSLLWHNQRNREFCMNPELSELSSSSILFNSTNMKPAADLSCSILPATCASLSYLEAGNPGINRRNNSSYLTVGVCPWSDVTAEKGNHSHLSGDLENIYWSEYLQGNFPVSSLLHFQIQPLQGGEIKMESNFDMESLGFCFQNQQPELQ